MTQPCEQKDVINEIRASQKSMEMAVKRQEENTRELVVELRAVVGELKDVLLDGRESKTKLTICERNIDTIFTMVRQQQQMMEECKREEISPLKDWQNKMEGAIKLLGGIPIVTSILSFIIALFAILKDRTPP